MRKVDDGEEKKRKKKKTKIMTFIVATNVIASRPPERRSTGTPHARAIMLPEPSIQFSCLTMSEVDRKTKIFPMSILSKQ